MKKRGFTLVELLAVIAILAILVIMALPAVLRMFEKARVDSFTNEINTIIRTTRQQYLLMEEYLSHLIVVQINYHLLGTQV